MFATADALSEDLSAAVLTGGRDKAVVSHRSPVASLSRQSQWPV